MIATVLTHIGLVVILREIDQLLAWAFADQTVTVTRDEVNQAI